MEIDRMETDNQTLYSESFEQVRPCTEHLPISGIMTIRNAISLGYPYLEVILHVLPVVDEFIIGDGGSEDETVMYLERLSSVFPKKIKLLSTPWEKSKHWESFDKAVDILISRASGSWLWETHGDEFWHEKDVLNLVEIIKKANKEGYNSLRNPCVLYGWTKRDSYIYRNIRMLRKVSGLSSHWGGDDFQIGDCRSPRAGLTSHNVPPELDIDIELMHISRIFPKHKISQDEINIKFCGTASESRKKIYESTKAIDWERRLSPKKEEVLDCLPALIKGLSQELKYKVREELFDKEWLEKTTGLSYK